MMVLQSLIKVTFGGNKMENNLKEKCNKVYSELKEEMYSEKPNLHKLILLVGKVESLREVLNYQVEEIEYAYILINKLGGLRLWKN